MYTRGPTAVKPLLNLGDCLAVRGMYTYTATYLKINRDVESNGSCTEIYMLSATSRSIAISKNFVYIFKDGVLESVDGMFQDKNSIPILHVLLSCGSVISTFHPGQCTLQNRHLPMISLLISF